MSQFFHITPTANVPAILMEGLQARIGPRSEQLGEPAPAVYLFATLEAADNALGNWLGECFEDDEQLSLLAVDLSLDHQRALESWLGESVDENVTPPVAIDMTQDLRRALESWLNEKLEIGIVDPSSYEVQVPVDIPATRIRVMVMDLDLVCSISDLGEIEVDSDPEM